ncbi:MAG TPA: NAD(P)-binding protein [Thermoanaerobaculia bacterium]|nr:NAD(P)-binding protein [Thermoanaerobaculia bacterium]
MNAQSFDVLIVGGGLAGLTLARQLLLNSEKRILLIDRRADLPPSKQKVGEATVQMSGYYYGKVLDLEEYLLQEHYLKYNLRFYWNAGENGEADGGPASRYEEVSQSYIRSISNIPTYQLDRNRFEAEVLRRNRENPRFEFIAATSSLHIELSEDGGPHAFRFLVEGREIAGIADWVVDASGRGRVLAKKHELARESPIHHGTTFFWVDGLLDIERLTDLSPRDRRTHPSHSTLGHLPAFLATNHFCGEGYWFWVIPLHGITSLGLVYDNRIVRREEVATPQKTIEWICRRHPLFARDLPGRKIVDQSGFVSFAHDSVQTISDQRWAMCGEACRFSDPLYSPGGDLISMYNTLIADAILTADRTLLPSKVRLYEQLARSIYEAYVPSFAVSYETLGDQETFTLRYVWELTVYFGFYVFPFINDLFTDPTFGAGFLRRFARLGPTNRKLHELLLGFFRWKQANPAAPPRGPVCFDFTEFGHLKAAEACFYKVGISSVEARQVLDEQLENLEDLARQIVAHVTWVVIGDPRAFSDPYVRSIELHRLAFDVEAMRERLAACPPDAPAYAWRIPMPSLARFRGEAPALAGGEPFAAAGMELAR